MNTQMQSTTLNIPAPEDRPPIDPTAPKKAGFIVKNPEDKMYILLFYFNDECKEYEIVTGRNEARETAKGYIEEGANLKSSLVLVEGNPIERSVTLYEFMKHMERYFNDNFYVDDYVTADEDTEANPMLAEETMMPGDGMISGQSFDPTTAYDESEESEV